MPAPRRVPLTTLADPTDPSSPWVLSYFAQRRIAGWIGIFLPIVVAIITLTFDCPGHKLVDSISASYYTHARSYFVASLASVGVFMIAGVGYDEDRILSWFAGAMAFIVAFAPCNGIGNVPCFPILQHTRWIHFPAAILLFIDFAYMCAFRFTRTNGQKSPSESPQTLTAEKRKRNGVYRFCAGVMLFAMTVQAVSFIPFAKCLKNFTHLTFTVETVCLIAFGIAWLVKGQRLLADSNPSPNP